MEIQIDTVEKSLYNMLLPIEKLTLPDILNERLEKMPVGRFIDFHANYSDEIPDQAIRTQILKYLDDYPSTVNGMIKDGKIYHTSPNPIRRAASILGNILAVTLGGVFIVLLYTVHAFSKDLTLQELLTSYTSVMVGGVAHYMVNAVKQFRIDPSKTLMKVVGDGLLWFHVMETTFFFGILTLFMGSLGIIFLNLGTDLWTGFFAGYGIDSIIDLVLLRFTDISSARTDALKREAAQPAPVKTRATR